MTNLHSAGEALGAFVIAGATAHSVQLDRGGVVSDVFAAASGPIGTPVLFAETGVVISQSERVFFWKATLTGALGLPVVGDIVIDQSDGSRWRILPTPTDDAWQWHGQLRTMVQVFTKQDTLNVQP